METQVLAGRYRLHRQLGKGGMGSVWLAEHLALNSWVAVKLMDPSIAATVEGAERFRREAQAAASLRSAHVVQVLDYGVHESTPFLVMELLQGQSLAECLERERRLSPERTLSIVTQVARAMGRAHAAGIVHRDLKPDNIFLVREDDQELAKVLDFGIAKTKGHPLGSMETRTGVTMGTPYYMSPEQIEGKKALDHRSDLWSLTVIACECASGVRPFDGDTYGELLLNICARPIAPPSQQGFYLPGFDEWFARGANRDPEQRFGSAQELASSLADVVSGRASMGARALPGTSVQPKLALNRATLPLSDSQLGQLVAAAVTTTAQQSPRESAQRRGLLVLAAALGLSIPIGVLSLLVLKRERPSSVQSVPAPSAAAAAGFAPGTTLVAPLLEPPLSQATDAAHQPKFGAHELPQAKPQPSLNPSRESANSGALARAAPPPSAPKSALTPSSNGRTVRCYDDPFTGQMRLADTAHAAGSFPCHQNPFTGAFQRQ